MRTGIGRKFAVPFWLVYAAHPRPLPARGGEGEPAFPVLSPRRNSIAFGFVASLRRTRSDAMGRGILLWLLGIPIPVIILLYIFHVI
jgi:hypothetical protein